MRCPSRFHLGSLIILCSPLLAADTPAIQPHAEPQLPTTIRLVAYNIRHGAGMDGRMDLRRTADVIRRLDPDLVALQEVDSATTRTNRIDQAHRLGELTGLHAAFGGFMAYREGQYGMALLSRYPIVGFANHRLPDGEEPRTALAAVVQIPGSDLELVLVGIHLYRTAAERLAQARRIVEIFDDDPRPIMLAGDFNSTPDSDVIDLLARHWQVADKGDPSLTFPSDNPNREIDFVLFRPAERFTMIRSRVIAEPMASDHRPVLLEFTLGAQ
jgi:endonuclease/exonuclease/phosphatase family metal-dependent hydrolase